MATCVKRILAALACTQVAWAQSHRDPQSGELVKFVNTLSTSGEAGHTTYEVGMTINGNVKNIYTLVGSRDHNSVIPPAFQVPAPFGANSGGVNPAYFPYNAHCQYDSWLTVGKTDGSSGLGGIGIDYSSWTETSGMTFDNGAVFWMDPAAATPARSSVASAATNVVLAHLTIATGTNWHMTIGEIQGRSLGGAVDWQEADLHFSNVAATDCRRPSDPYGYNLQENSLALSSFSVTATCAQGYTGHAVVSPCPSADEEYALSGCAQMCSSPSQATQGNYAVTETSRAWGSNFVVTAQCCPGSTGTAVVRMCPLPNTPYSLSGCSGTNTGCGGGGGTPPPPPTGATMTVYVINTQNQCGESTFPQSWASYATQWARTNNLNVQAGTCASVGYTVSAGQTTVPRSSAPSDPVVMLYTHPSCTDDAAGTLAAFGYSCAQARQMAGTAGCSFDMSSAGFAGAGRLSAICPSTCNACAGVGPGGH